MNKFEETLKKVFKPGTSQGKFSFGALFFLAGLLFVLLGFWKTLLVVALTAIGVFIGSAESLGKATSNLIDKVYPPKNQKVVYTKEDLEKVRKATEMKKEAQQEATKKDAETEAQTDSDETAEA